MRKYLVIPTFDDSFEKLLIIQAENTKAVLKTLSYQFKDDETFLENVYEKSINMSFAEQFWIANNESAEIFQETGNHPISEDEFKENVRKYFHDKPQYAELFIDYYFIEFSDDRLREYKFPDEMMRYIYIKEFDERDWKILDMEKIEVLSDTD